MQVELADVRHWQREAFALLRRRTLPFVVLSTSYFYAAYILQAGSWLTFFVGLLACHASLAVSLVIARDADESRDFSITECYRGLLSAVIVLLVTTVVYTLIWFAAALVASKVTLDVPVNDYTGTIGFQMLQWLSTGTMNLFVLYCCVMVAGLWFLLPLAVFHPLGLFDALKLAKTAEQRNLVVVMMASYVPFFVFLLTFMLSEVALALAFAAMPLYGAYMYVAYRHVFLGKRENEPQRVAIQATQSSPS
jgi:hypothetical protein